jgi:hypothetical protein
MLIFADMVGGWVDGWEGVAIFQYIYILPILLDWHTKEKVTSTSFFYYIMDHSYIIKRWSKAESFTIFENHVYPCKKSLMFAINLVNFCSIFGRVFSYATQVKVCNKFGKFLLHFWEGFFLCYTGKSLQ